MLAIGYLACPDPPSFGMAWVMRSDLIWLTKVIFASLGLAVLIKTLGTSSPLPQDLGMVWTLLLLPSGLMALILGVRRFS